MTLPPETKKLLADMLDFGEQIATFVKAKSEADYLSDVMMQRAVERCFAVIGEALTALRRSDPATAQSLTDWRSIISFRNVLIHAYGGIDQQRTWRIIEEGLPVLLREVRALLA